MHAADIRARFLAYFQRQSHAVRPSSSLVPGDDPTLLFTNAGMVQFKKVFLGLEQPPEGNRRATTSQKCVRAGGKHNDLEQVGHTARHHTFFEMLGNFSFGDYFKRDAIRFAWEFVTEELKIPKQHLRVTVYKDDDEARQLWIKETGIAASRVYGLGERDNFWQMADTGPCGPCTEIYVDLAQMAKDYEFPAGATGEWTERDRQDFSLDAFVEGAEAGRFLEIWNLVFMQFDRQSDGVLQPLPKPSVDTGAGLERIAAVMQGVANNYHTDLFKPLLDRVVEVTGKSYAYHNEDSASYRVLADHARAVSFLLADGVFPSNEGRGYVLRRILRRAVRHAWLLGRREPTLVLVVERVIEMMQQQFPELAARKKHILDTTRAEEERFLATVEGGLERFEQLAPTGSTQGSDKIRGTISGDDVFKLYDTFGFPVDLTELMARERGYLVDIAGFEAALDAQRKMSQEDRKSRKLGVVADELNDMSTWTTEHAVPESGFVGYERTTVSTAVTGIKELEGGQVAVMLRESPFYAESGGQISDRGEIRGENWSVDVTEVRKIDGKVAAIGVPSGNVRFGLATATVPADRRRDTERNHTATHLLHAALRHVLGEHVHQAGSLVAPERLRFDFTHHGPIHAEQLAQIEQMVNDGIWANVELRIVEKPYQEAIAGGAMALFGEKYGDVVRVVEIPGLSTELCGGTHVKNTGTIGLFRIVSESGVAAGVRRIEAVTGRGAFALLREREQTLVMLAERLKVNALSADVIGKKLDGLLAEKKTLEKRLDEALKGGGAQQDLLGGAELVGGVKLVAKPVNVPTMKDLQALGDVAREGLGSGAAALLGSFEDGKLGLVVVITDDLRARGLSAGAIVKALGAKAGIKGGGKEHMAQAGVPDGQGEAVLGLARAEITALLV
ncbi:alanine--tRNA ligase [Pseudogemmatithrix spongiicola]|uniref:Alanine--tRNA ligase n=1 Tax=Pseudogemmatithrix spongiicola TaxID=3062599 RepID=A0AA49K191_9BACT|nr:alanine--tRNA ligase [Gemmatimonadaceae bacterium 'strain 138']WKW15378.1 alanine--tRNA ligase [Gemmatimonadaceae bacterium 'strain 318']